MATLRESIFSVLQADATLRNLLSKSADPYGIYFMNPPKSPPFQLVTIFENAATGDFPRIGAFQITAWHGDRDAIHRRIYDLLHNQVFTVTDYGHIRLLFDWMGPDLYDQEWHVYFRQARFRFEAIKK